MHDFENALLFKCIAEEGSLTKAATKFQLNASAVSKRLHKLENSLGTQLIKRTTRQLLLTEAGQCFYEKVVRLQHDWQTAVDETSHYGKSIQGKLIIAAPQPLASRFLMPVIAQFTQQYPAIEIDIRHQQIEQLPCMSADISISRELDHYDSQSMRVRSFFRYRNSLFASPTYLEQHAKIEQLSDLSAHRCLCYPANSTWHFVQQSIELKNTFTMNNAEIMISAATQGLGIAYLPSVIINDELKNGSLVPVLDTYQSKQLSTCVYYMQADFVPQKIRLFIDFLCASYASSTYSSPTYPSSTEPS